MTASVDSLVDLTKAIFTESQPAPIASPEFWVRAQIKQLSSYSLVRVDGQSFSLHLLLQSVEQFATPANIKDLVVDSALEALLDYAPESADLPATWNEWNALNPHAVELHSHSGSCSPQLRISLLDALARFSFGKARYGESLAYEEEAFNLAERTYGPDAEETQDRLINYGESLREEEHFVEAEDKFRRALEWRKERYGTNHLDVATANNYLGLLLRVQGINEPAEVCFRDGIQICENIDHCHGRTYVKLLLNLAYMCLSGRTPEAETLARTALTKAVEEFGEDDILTLFGTEVLAVALNNQRKYGDAVPLQEKTVEIMIRVLGQEHPHTIQALDCLMRLYGNIGDLDKELKCSESILKSNEILRGYQHIETLEAAATLAEQYLRRGNLESAEPLFRRVIAGFDLIPGESHLRVSKALLGLINILEKTERFEESKPFRTRLIKQQLTKTDATPLEG